MVNFYEVDDAFTHKTLIAPPTLPFSRFPIHAYIQRLKELVVRSLVNSACKKQKAQTEVELVPINALFTNYLRAC